MPNWLKVDMATTFLKSLSIFAQTPATNIVKIKKNFIKTTLKLEKT